MATEKKVTSKDRAAVFLKAAFEILHEAGGSLPIKEIKQEVEKRVMLTPYDREIYEGTGYVRWESTLHLYSIDCTKAVFLRKQDGQWHLTPDGEAVRQLAADELLEKPRQAYRRWKIDAGIKMPPVGPINGAVGIDDIRINAKRSFIFESAESEARNEIKKYVQSVGHYEFPELVAALLRAMAYTTPFVAPKGPDGGTDILAYPDPLGASLDYARVRFRHRAFRQSFNSQLLRHSCGPAAFQALAG